MREASAIEYAMCKLESQKKETLEHFDSLITNAKNFVGNEVNEIAL